MVTILFALRNRGAPDPGNEWVTCCLFHGVHKIGTGLYSTTMFGHEVGRMRVPVTHCDPECGFRVVQVPEYSVDCRCWEGQDE
jgi:hypothetical protein